MTSPAIKARPGRKNAPGRLPDPAYLALIRRFPLRPVRSDEDYELAVQVLDSLVVLPEGSLGRGEQDYLDTLTMLVEAYDAEHHVFAAKKYDSLSMLRYIMQESGTTQADLGRLLGNRAIASMILNGHRQLSKSHIRKLADHFKVSPALFFKQSPPS